MLNGELYKGWKIFNAQLLHQPATVGFNGFGRKKEGLCDLSTRLTFDNQLKHLAFAWTEVFNKTLLRIRPALMNVVFDNSMRNAIGQKAVP